MCKDLLLEFLNICPLDEFLFRFQLRKQNHIANTFLAEQHHAKPVNSDSHSAGRRHAVFKRNQKILVQFLLLAAGLMLQPLALLNRVVLLGVTGRNFLAVDAALEDFNAVSGRRATFWRAAQVLLAGA